MPSSEPRKLIQGHSLQLNVAGRAGVPTDASTVVLTVAAVDPLANASLTVLARLGAGGDVCVFSYATTHLIVDVAGYLTGPPPPAAGPTCPQPQQIAYLTNLEIAFVGYVVPQRPSDDYSDLRIMNADGSNQRNLTNDPTRFDRSPAWSADGTQIVFDSAGPLRPVLDPDGELLGFAHDPQAEIYLTAAAGGTKLQLTSGEHTVQSPSWRPPGAG